MRRYTATVEYEIEVDIPRDVEFDQSELFELVESELLDTVSVTLHVENDEPDDEGDTWDEDYEVTVRQTGGASWYDEIEKKTL